MHPVPPELVKPPSRIVIVFSRIHRYCSLLYSYSVYVRSRYSIYVNYNYHHH
jgi:hypothetical protein